MISRFTVEHFRGIGSLEMNGLKTVNVLVGKNNCGKTSLLEALYIASSVLRRTDGGLGVNIERGMEWSSPEHLNTLFHQLDFNTCPKVSIQNDANQKLVAEVRPIFPNEQHGIVAPPDRQAAMIPAAHNLAGIKFFAGSDETHLEQWLSLVWRRAVNTDRDAEGLVSEPCENKLAVWYPSVAFIPAGMRKEVAGLGFDAIVKDNREKEISEALRVFVPTIQNIKTTGKNILLVENGKPNLPLLLQGDGTVRAFTLAVALINFTGGAVLVDEIDNGIHASALKPFWKTLLSAARKNNTQFFATTHSWESLQCLKAALDEDAESQDHAAVFNLVRRAEDKISVYPYTYPDFKDVMETGVDIR